MEEYIVKLLKYSLVINYMIQYIPFILLQCTTLLLFGLHFVPSSTIAVNITLLIITTLQFVLLALYTLCNTIIILCITSGLLHLLWKHYKTIQGTQEQDPLCKSKSQNMKLALFHVVFFMISITLTLLWKIFMYCMFILSILLEQFFAQSRILYVIACAGFVIVVYAMLIIAIVLYSPRNFKSLKQFAEQVIKQLEMIPKEKKNNMEQEQSVESVNSMEEKQQIETVDATPC